MRYGITLVLCVSASLANAISLRIVGWDLARGGRSSLAQAAGYESTRQSILAAFPGSTFVGLSALTASGLAGADAVWLGMTYLDGVSVSPLSMDEQSALAQAYRGNSTLFLFGGNLPFAQAANSSLFDWYSLGVQGNLTGLHGHFVGPPHMYPLAGPYGTVYGPLSSNPGWFDPNRLYTFREVATLAGTSSVSIATRRRGWSNGRFEYARIWAFAGEGGHNSAGAVNAQAWNRLYLNMLSERTWPAFGVEWSTPDDFIVGARTLVGTAHLEYPLAVDTVIPLWDDTQLLQTPASVTIRAGTTSRSFTVRSTAIASGGVDATVSARYRDEIIPIRYVRVRGIYARTVSLASNTVTGGQTVTCTVVVGGPAGPGGRAVSIYDNSAFSSVPKTVIVPEGAIKVSFPITTRIVSAPVFSRISAATSAGVVWANLGITP